MLDMPVKESCFLGATLVLIAPLLSAVDVWFFGVVGIGWTILFLLTLEFALGLLIGGGMRGLLAVITSFLMSGVVEHVYNSPNAAIACCATLMSLILLLDYLSRKYAKSQSAMKQLSRHEAVGWTSGDRPFGRAELFAPLNTPLGLGEIDGLRGGVKLILGSILVFLAIGGLALREENLHRVFAVISLFSSYYLFGFLLMRRKKENGPLLYLFVSVTLAVQSIVAQVVAEASNSIFLGITTFLAGFVAAIAIPFMLAIYWDNIRISLPVLLADLWDRSRDRPSSSDLTKTSRKLLQPDQLGERTVDTTIARPNRGERLFPLITPTLYCDEPAQPDSSRLHFAGLLSDLASHRLPFLQRHFALQLTPTQRLVRLLGDHRRAFEGELEGKFEFADFFWERVVTQYREIQRNGEEAWSGLAARTGGVTPAFNPGDMAHRFPLEVLLDTHIAFFNGYTRDESRQENSGTNTLGLTLDRRRVHFAWIETYLAISDTKPGEKLQTMRFFYEERIRDQVRRSGWTAAIETGRALLNLDPSDPSSQHQFAMLHLECALKQLNTSGKPGASERNIAMLKLALIRLKALIDSLPYCVAVYEAMGLLSLTLALECAKDRQLAEALLLLHRALLCDPSLEQRPPQSQLVAMLRQLEKQAVTAGKLPDELERFNRSEEASTLRRQVTVARARDLWRQVGLAPLPAGQDDEALHLMVAVSRIQRSPPPSVEMLEVMWQLMSVSLTALGRIDRRPVFEFILRRLRGEPEPEPIVNAPPANPPWLATSTLRRKKSIPFGDWLFYQEATGEKTLMALAVCSFLIAGGLTLRDLHRDEPRTEAYQHMLMAHSQGDYQKVVEGAERFASNLPLSGHDLRTAQVLDLQAEALTRWSLASSAVGPELKEHMDQYRDFRRTVQE